MVPIANKTVIGWVGTRRVTAATHPCLFVYQWAVQSIAAVTLGTEIKYWISISPQGDAFTVNCKYLACITSDCSGNYLLCDLYRALSVTKPPRIRPYTFLKINGNPLSYYYQPP